MVRDLMIERPELSLLDAEDLVGQALDEYRKWRQRTGYKQ
jgi:hypothetical protein